MSNRRTLRTIRRFCADESGATAVEYGLIAAFIACVLISSIRGIGTKLNNKFTAISNGLS